MMKIAVELGRSESRGRKRSFLNCLSGGVDPTFEVPA